MTGHPERDPAKPVPVPTEETREFFEGAIQRKLLMQRCRSCGGWMWGSNPRCSGCFSANLEWAQASGRGTVYSYTLVYNCPDPAFAEDIPYNLVQVELEEGVRILTVLTGVEPDELAVGLPVEVWFDQLNSEVGVPKFRLAETVANR